MLHGKNFIDVKDEREFKLWVKFIASIQKEGGNISRPLDILWNSVKNELDDKKVIKIKNKYENA